MRKLMTVIACLFSASVLSGCGAQPPQAEATGPEEITLAVTRWTDKAELFMEYPVLVAGKTGRFAVHFTNLKTFKPATGARVIVELQVQGATDEFVADPQTRPGIFGVNVTPKRSGPATMTVRIESPPLTDSVIVDDVTVYQDEQQAANAAPPEPTEETIPFLKEQQWALDFGTALAENRRLRSGFLVPAEVIPRTGGMAEVAVPFNGRLVVSNLPDVGSHVTQGQVLAQLLPPTSAPSDLASIESSQSQAAAELALARKDRERAERLLASGAAPAKRLDEARAAEAVADARLKAANERLGRLRGELEADGAQTGSIPHCTFPGVGSWSDRLNLGSAIMFQESIKKSFPDVKL